MAASRANWEVRQQAPSVVAGDQIENVPTTHHEGLNMRRFGNRPS